MKPTYLELSAFGPFAGQVILPLEQIVSEGVFLVHGVTGAGKTTIFDAISFALFGNASGENRPTESLRSDFAKEEIRTYVILRFTHGGKNYKIERQPAYIRPKQRGEGYTESKAEAVLTMPDGGLVVGYSEVNEKVKEILSVDRTQFKQISMIAQGEFMKLLTVDSKERGAIFRKVFRTGELFGMGEELKRRMLKTKGLCEEKDKAVLQYYRGIDNSAESEYKETVEAFFAQPDIYKTKDFPAMLADFNKKDKVLYEEKQKLLAKAEQELTGLKVKEAKLAQWWEKKEELRLLNEQLPQMLLEEEQNRQDKQRLQMAQKAASNVRPYAVSYETAKRERESLFAMLAEKEREVEELKAQEENINIAYQKAQSDKSRLNELLLKIEQLRNEVKQLAEKEEQEATLKAMEKAMEQEDAAIALDAKTLLEKEERYNWCRKKQDELTEIYQQGTELERKERELKKELEEVGLQKQKFSSYSETRTNYETLTSELDLMLLKRKACLRELQEMEEAYTREQAGMLALDLVEGRPCPVCGSTEHPYPAKLSGGAPKKEDVEAKRKECEELRDKIEASGNVAASDKKTMELLLEQMGIRLNSDTQLPTMERYEERDRMLRQALSEVQTQIDVLLEAQKEGMMAREEGEYLLSELQQDREALNFRRERRQMRQSEMAVIQQTIQRIMLNSESKTALEAAEAVNNGIAQMEQRKEEIALAERKYQEWNEISKSENAVLEQLYSQRLVRMQKEQVALEEFERALQSVGFLSEEEYQRSALSGEEVEALGEKTAKTDAKILRFREKLELLRKEADKEEDLQDEGLKEQLLFAAARKENLSDACTRIFARMETNEKIRKNVEVLLAEREVLQQEYADILALSNVANGEMPGREKLPFEQYVQAFYFEQVIREANLRLKKMSGGRFALLRKQEAGNKRSITGLDLEVMDYFTGKARNVKSLSGGESFKAALALALGLSDVIQRSAGGIVVETMFVDEGFGSLDKDSLEQAITILKDLAGSSRLVGIISHVEELKESIEKKILVEKSAQGSRVSYTN